MTACVSLPPSTAVDPLIPKSATTQMTRPIADIKIGKRHRKDLGDIEGFAELIRAVGLLHPVPIRPDGTLVAGERRLAACKLLGWIEVPVHVVPLDEIVRGEFAENWHRKDFTLSEAVAIKRALEPLEKAAAKERQAAGLKQGRNAPRAGKLPERDKGRAADKVAKATGITRRTLEMAEAIVDAAEAEPQKLQPIAGADERDRAREWLLSSTQNREAGRANPRRTAAIAWPWAVPSDRGRFAVAVR
jgi:ParB-like chromosome segregation protein Spo0J